MIEIDDVALKSAVAMSGPEIVWGPMTIYAGKTGLPATVVTLPVKYENDYITLYVVNGEGGLNTVSGVTVTIDGVPVITSTDLRKNLTAITGINVKDKSSITISITAKGKSTNFVTVRLEGVPVTVTPPSPGDFVDKAGRGYHTVTIGTLTWMAENLAYLPSVNSNTELSTTVSRFYVYDYSGNSVNDAKAHTKRIYLTGEQTLDINCFQTYGVLYNLPAALSSLPDGSEWRLPTKEDWEYLARCSDNAYVGYENNNAGQAMKSTSGWNLVYSDALNGLTEKSNGFNGLPGGSMAVVWDDGSQKYVGYFQEILSKGIWLSNSTLLYGTETWFYQNSLYSFLDTYVNKDVSRLASRAHSDCGMSVRYVKGTLPTP